MITSRLVRLVFALGAVPAALCAATPRPPNIVFLFADDLGWSDLGAYGSTFYETPHLDRLAKEGARFTSAYAACPVCSPTRASVITGKYPQRTGITDYIGAPQPPAWKRNTRLLPAPYTTELALAETTLAEALKPAGYATFFAGKWHLGPKGHWPEDQGFDVNLGGNDKGGPYGGDKYFSPYGNPSIPDGPKGEHLPDRLAREAAAFIAKNKAQPFLVYLPFYDVHTPLMARADLRAKYEEKRRRLAPTTQWGREGERDVRLTQNHAVYAGMVEAMDQAVGTILQALRDHDLERDTLVVFTSDNGGLSTSEGWPTSNLPLRGGKGWLYEGGVREPLIVRWAGRIAAGQVIDTPVSSPDFFPTFLAAAGVKPAADLPPDGVNLLPLLTARAVAPDRALFWHYPHYGNQGGAPGAAVRRGDWKLIEWFEEGALELYNLRTDPGEQKNLAAAEPARVQALRAELQAWQKNVGAKFPTSNAAYDPAKPSGRFSARPPEAGEVR
ncbi:MAG: sulfatase [Opitutaceae bacterium]|nr:sulfatase [Opitutaceae bacterium]